MDGRMRLTWVAVLWATMMTGCAKPWTASQPWGTQLKPMAEPVEVDRPAVAAAGEQPVTETSAPDAPAPSSSLAEEIQAYVGRFPSDDLDRKASPSPAAPSRPMETPRRVVESSEPQPPDRADTPPGELALVRVTSPSASLPAEASPSEALTPWQQKGGTVVPSQPKQKTPDEDAAPPAQEAVVQPKVELIAVRSAVSAEASQSADQTKPNQPVESIARPADDSMAAMIERLEASVAAHPEQLDDVYKLALIHLSFESDDRASRTAEKADPIRGDLIAAVVDVVRATRQVIREPGLPASAALEAAEHLRTLLAQRSSVTVSKAVFVTSVQSFGVYQEVPPRFPVGQGVHVFLYTEVANFRSEPTGDGRLKTVMSETVEIYDADGNVIWQQSHPTIQDVVLTPRRDFFIPLEIKLPPGTPAGEYTLKVKIEDKVGLTADQRRMVFTIGNP